MTKRNPFRPNLPEMAQGLREQAASETAGSEQRPDHTGVIQREAEAAAVRAFLIEEGIITHTALNTMIRLTKERDEARVDLAEATAEIRRLTYDRNHPYGDVAAADDRRAL